MQSTPYCKLCKKHCIHAKFNSVEEIEYAWGSPYSRSVGVFSCDKEKDLLDSDEKETCSCYQLNPRYPSADFVTLYLNLNCGSTENNPADKILEVKGHNLRFSLSTELSYSANFVFYAPCLAGCSLKKEKDKFLFQDSNGKTSKIRIELVPVKNVSIAFYTVPFLPALICEDETAVLLKGKLGFVQQEY